MLGIERTRHSSTLNCWTCRSEHGDWKANCLVHRTLGAFIAPERMASEPLGLAWVSQL
jgi:hypothetical protein